MLQQQAEQLAHNRQLLRPSPAHPQALQHQPEDSGQEGQDGHADPPEPVPAERETRQRADAGGRAVPTLPRLSSVLPVRNKVFSDKTPQT